MTIEEVKQALRRRRVTRTAIDRSKMLSTGSTLLNLAVSGFPDVGIPQGEYVFFVGDTSSGKTFFARTILAEATINPAFDKYRLIYRDLERGAKMDTARYFGEALAERLEEPKPKGDVFLAEDWYFEMFRLLDGPKPIIYVLDSENTLSSDDEEKKINKKMKAKSRAEVKGDFGDGKAKIHSRYMRKLISKLVKSGSILIVIGQTRDNLNAGMFGPKSTKSGGRALTFYAMCELWSSVGERLKRKVRGAERKIGINCRFHIKKNRATGRDRVVEVPLYYSAGVDDVGGCVDYLLNEKYWKVKRGAASDDDDDDDDDDDAPKKKRGGLIVAKELDLILPREELIAEIQEQGLEKKLQATVANVWAEIEAGCEVVRVNKYAKKKVKK